MLLARPVQLRLRRAALLLALVCLWLSAGATLCHTDDLGALRTFAAGRSVARHSAPPPAAVPCVAHEWMNAWQTLHTARPPLAWTPVTLATVPIPSAPPALHLRCFDYTSLRGPPTAFFS